MAINFNIKTTNMDLTPALSSYVHEKIGTVEKYLNPEGDQEIKAQVEIGLRTRKHRNGDIYRAEVNLSFDGKKYRAVSKQEDMNAAIDSVKDEITRIVRKRKEKGADMERKGSRILKRFLKRGGN
jgi:putative sigma-54 modulation protein